MESQPVDGVHILNPSAKVCKCLDWYNVLLMHVQALPITSRTACPDTPCGVKGLLLYQGLKCICCWLSKAIAYLFDDIECIITLMARQFLMHEEFHQGNRARLLSDTQSLNITWVPTMTLNHVCLEDHNCHCTPTAYAGERNNNDHYCCRAKRPTMMTQWRCFTC